MSQSPRHRRAGPAAPGRGPDRAQPQRRRRRSVRRTLHWAVRVLSVLGTVATLAIYILVTKTAHDRSVAAAPVPGPSESTPAGPRWESPTDYAATSARAAFLGTLTGPVGDIPTPALAAYDRAAQVINAADTACHLHWTLLAGIGWVETQHGNQGGSTLDVAGTMTIPFFGPALAATDTDAGNFDERDDVDRPVGPLQFMPRLWAEVGVDADGDTRRDPQDIDDAALGLAVFLCSGDGDLADPTDAVARLETFNTVEGYAPAVLRASEQYLNTAVEILDPGVEAPGDMVLLPEVLPEATTAPAPSTSTSIRPSAKASPSPTSSTGPTVSPPADSTATSMPAASTSATTTPPTSPTPTATPTPTAQSSASPSD